MRWLHKMSCDCFLCVWGVLQVSFHEAEDEDDFYQLNINHIIYFLIQQQSTIICVKIQWSNCVLDQRMMSHSLGVCAVI